MDSWGLPLAADGTFLGARGSRYKPVNLLGRGSFGTCVLARLTTEIGTSSCSTFRVVKAVDLLTASDEDTASRRSEALREAEVLKSLSHPNIIGYDDAFLADAHLCIVMEYADGGDLAAAIARRREAARRYHEREAMAIFAQLALALRHVHDLRILHRDVKSQNVFLTSGGVVKLGDFGVAKVLAASELCAATRIGTPQCCPPELCENHPYDFKADVWGLGICLYETLALQCPFNGASFAALAVRICTAEPHPVPSVYSHETRKLVSRLLAKRAEDRPSSAEILVMPHVRRSVAALPERQAPSLSARAERGGGGLSAALLAEASIRALEDVPLTERLRRRCVSSGGLRRCATLPECSSPDAASRQRKGSMAHKPCMSATASSPKKVKPISPRKFRSIRDLSDDLADLVSPKKAARMVWTPTKADRAPENFASPDSRGSVSDLLALILESPSANQQMPKTGRSDGAETTSTRAATFDGGSARSAAEGCEHDGKTVLHVPPAEDLVTCTALLSALEKEFGLV